MRSTTHRLDPTPSPPSHPVPPGNSRRETKRDELLRLASSGAQHADASRRAPDHGGHALAPRGCARPPPPPAAVVHAQ
eukprot:1635929-Pyramimonas_sp.AAC.1